MTESDLQVQVANYLRMQYPDVIFHSDFGGRRAWPDMFIAAPSFDWNNDVYNDDGKWAAMPHFGLFLELKKEGTRLKKKNGEWASEHIAEQAAVLNELERWGYVAKFAVGFDVAKKIIDEYLEGANG